MIKFRKSALKSIRIALILSLTLVPTGMAYAYDTPVSHVDASNSINWPYTTGANKIAASSSIGFMGATWLGTINRWHFDFRFAGTGASRATTSPPIPINNRIQIARMEIKNTQNPSNMALNSYTDPAFIGSAPESSGSNLPGYYNAAYAVLNFSTFLLTPMSGFLYNTGSLIASLRNVSDSNTTSASALTRQWNWSTDIADTGQFFWFSADVPANTTSQLSAEYMLLGTGYEVLSAGKRYYNLTAGTARSSNSLAKSAAIQDKDWNPGMMTPEEKAECGIIEIPRDEIDQQASKLNIAPSVVTSLKASEDQVFYYATKFPVTESIRPTNEELTPKEKSIQDINDQLDRSETIIDAFQRYDTKNTEQELIIKDHESQELILQGLLQRANQTDENDLRSLSEIQLSLSDLK
ncbi:MULTISPECIES: hypothetical protein [unclassified Paenibacillus]|uniref:hypothetical protein n=1 Tax=unclassified Paenibacillus TaxID=185978 RepID=UPI0030F9D3C2